jgi:hypothetical protein
MGRFRLLRIWAIPQFLAFKIGRDEMKGCFIDMKGD